MRRPAAAALAALVAAVCCSSAGSRDAAAIPVASLSAAPARVTLTGGERVVVTLRNFGASALTVTTAVAGLTLDARGKPRVFERARSMVRVAPKTLTVAPGDATPVVVESRLPTNAGPGDHHAAVLFATRARTTKGVAIRMRLAVRVVVRAPGAIVRRLDIRGVRVRRLGERRLVEVRLANRGNVTETLSRGRLTIRLHVRGREFARLRSGPRELLPRSAAVVGLTYRGRVRGVVRADVIVTGAGRRTFRVRL